MASPLCLRDVEKLPGTLQAFYSQIIITKKKIGNPSEMSAFHFERSGWVEMHRRRMNLQKLSDRSNQRPRLSFQELQNSSIAIFKRGSAGARSVTQIRRM
jgi:hypothetical protein